MTTIELVLGIILMVLSVAMVIVVLFQPSKDKRLSGAIAGSADTFVGKGKGNSREKMLSKVTVGLAIVFFILVVVMYCIV